MHGGRDSAQPRCPEAQESELRRERAIVRFWFPAVAGWVTSAFALLFAAVVLLTTPDPDQRFVTDFERAYEIARSRRAVYANGSTMRTVP